MPSIIDIEGIGPVYKKKLKAAGIATTEKLLEVGGTPKGRKELAEKAGIDETLILEWVNLADLFRIKGVGSEYSDLLEEAGWTRYLTAQPSRQSVSKKVDQQHQKLVRKMAVKAGGDG